MGSELTLRPFYWRATELFPEQEIVSNVGDTVERFTYGDMADRIPALAAGLSELGVGENDRVGTLGWNHHRHYEAYFALPLMGAQLHTINVQLPDRDIVYIVNDAADDLLMVDPSMVETVERLWDQFESPEAVVVMGDDADTDTDLPAYSYDDILERGRERDFSFPEVSEEQPAGMCYTSGTTGRPKGVEYTHKMYYVHALMVMTPAGLNIDSEDVVLSLVPMYHVNSWEFPYASTMAGAKQVYPGPSPETADILDLIVSENVTVSAGVPTIWIDLLDYLDTHGGSLDSLERIIVGGSAAPESMMRRYEEEYDVTTDHAWGMTETMSIGSVSRPKKADYSENEYYAKRKKQGLLSPGLEMKVLDDEGNRVEWTGNEYGELYVRGPTVVPEYYNQPEANEEDFDGEWLKTGDIVAVDEDGYLDIVDRSGDVIKSGGEWISSIELENALMANENVLEAAVISVSEPRWQERPLACVVPKKDVELTPESLREYLLEEHDFPKWWLPDDVKLVESIPKTATGKFDKKVLREDFDDVDLRYTPGKE